MSDTPNVHPRLAERIVEFVNDRLADDENPVKVEHLHVFRFACVEEEFMFFRVFIDDFADIVCDVFSKKDDEDRVYVNFYELADQFTIGTTAKEKIGE